MNPLRKKLIRLGLLAALTASSSLLLAQPSGAQGAQGGPGGQGGPRQPPQEALDACKSLSAGQPCSFKSPHGTATGTCWAPESMALACKPKDAPNESSRPPRQ